MTTRLEVEMLAHSECAIEQIVLLHVRANSGNRTTDFVPVNEDFTFDMHTATIASSEGVEECRLAGAALERFSLLLRSLVDLHQPCAHDRNQLTRSRHTRHVVDDLTAFVAHTAATH